ncbi:hypothetical protein AKN91_08275 [Thiopseudomonas alkaliphila]|nr:hypothetical protein AKN91_08275 [Thiopseudomonas alkaliphila]
MNNLRLQTQSAPFDQLDELKNYLNTLREQGVSWGQVGILVDEGPESIILFLIHQKEIAVALRVALKTGENIEALKLFSPNLENIEYRSIQGNVIQYNDLISFEALKSLWSRASAQAKTIQKLEIKDLVLRLEESSLTTGRGKDFNTETTNTVLFESHGRCMFEGCAININLDEITGAKGNYSYLAHNVASSEKGPRGILYLSGELSNDPDNVLLLCDKHHRLIDKIATPDYPAERLSRMRESYINSANKLLNGLAYHPVKVYSVLWPVQKTTISTPSTLQVNQCLNKLEWRMDNEINCLSDNESTLRDLSSDIDWQILPALIEQTSKEILQQTHSDNYRAGLFVFGLMPALIGLGAKLGNKNEIYPMLRYRDGGQWTWPLDQPREEKPYTVNGLRMLSSNEKEVILTLAFTGNPPQFQKFQEEKPSLKTIEVVAHNLGNGSIGHPTEGINFMSEMQKLLLKLKNEHKIEKVYVLPCASNAVCVFFGKAYDNYHPELILCDFEGESMKPKLKVYNSNSGRCEIMSV